MTTDSFQVPGFTKSTMATLNPNKKTRVSGVILIDKPKGLTSQQVVSKVKNLFKSPKHDSKKAGHTGTLDPMATGLLPVCLGETTKYSHYQLDADKSYQATVQLGVQTDTGDAEGKVVEIAEVPSLNQEMLDKVTEQFSGAIEQTPPMYSALKKDGKKLYEYARAGIEVERASRPITIKELIIGIGESDDQLVITVTCSKGTYIRVLGEDIAKSLGTLGHLTDLRRTHVGHFDIGSAITLDEFKALEFSERFKHLMGIDSCIEGLPLLSVSETEYQRLHLGQRLNVRESLTSEILAYLNQNTTGNEPCDVRLSTHDGEFIGLGKLEANGRLQPKKMIQRP